MSEANKHQVGGTHYKTNYEHWDWCVALSLSYLEGTATKYVARWRKKNGFEDLKKALHYTNKLAECLGARGLGVDWDRCTDETQKFALANRLTSLEQAFCFRIATWQDWADVHLARDLLLQIMDEADPAKPVPVTDSNKHALHPMED